MKHMAKPGLKVKELAQELGVTSRALIDRCRENGLAVQNSITRLDPAAVTVVRRWFQHADVADQSENNHEATLQDE
jgi:hypothetical protein